MNKLPEYEPLTMLLLPLSIWALLAVGEGIDLSGCETRQDVLDVMSASNSIVKMGDNTNEWWSGNQCGVVTLYGMLSLLGYHQSLEEVRANLRVTERGSSLADLQTASAEFGLSTQVVRCDSDELAQLNTPAILHLAGGEGGHYVLFLGFHRESGDPVIADFSAGNVRKVSSGTLLRTWSRYALHQKRWPQTLTRISRYLSVAIIAVVLISLVRRRFGGSVPT